MLACYIVQETTRGSCRPVLCAYSGNESNEIKSKEADAVRMPCGPRSLIH